MTTTQREARLCPICYNYFTPTSADEKCCRRHRHTYKPHVSLRLPRRPKAPKAPKAPRQPQDLRPTQTPRRPTLKDRLNPATLGAMGEYAVALDLMTKGYAVFRAMSPTCYCDLIASTPGQVWEIEVKVGRQRPNGKWTFAGKQVLPLDVLCLAIWQRDLGTVTYLNSTTMQEILL